MLAITIKQPWATLIMQCGKDIENRTWSTRMRGRVAIHSSAKLERREYQAAASLIFHSNIQSAIPPEEQLDLGCILGTVEIVGCVQKSRSPWFQGPYGIVLKDPRLLDTPVPCKGALGFWPIPYEVESRMRFSKCATNA